MPLSISRSDWGKLNRVGSCGEMTAPYIMDTAGKVENQDKWSKWLRIACLLCLLYSLDTFRYEMLSPRVLQEIDGLFLPSARMLNAFHPGVRERGGCRSGTILYIVSLYLCILVSWYLVRSPPYTKWRTSPVAQMKISLQLYMGSPIFGNALEVCIK